MAAALSYLVTRTGGRSAGRRPLASLTGRHLNLPETETPAAPYFQNKRQGRQSIYAGKRELTFASREKSVILDYFSRDLRFSHQEVSNFRPRRREKFIILDAEIRYSRRRELYFPLCHRRDFEYFSTRQKLGKEK